MRLGHIRNLDSWRLPKGMLKRQLNTVVKSKERCELEHVFVIHQHTIVAEDTDLRSLRERVQSKKGSGSRTKL